MFGPTGRETTDVWSLRVSDAERAQAASAVDAAVADGRLTWTEHSERTTLIWSARTRGELAPMLADLGHPMTVDTTRPQRVTSWLSKVTRAPSAASRQLHARAVFGAVLLDLSGMQPGEQLEVRASSFCGKVVIKIADDATVIDDGGVLLGKRAIRGSAPRPGGPIVHLTGLSTLGNLKVYRASQGEWGHLEHHHAHPRGERHLHRHRDKHVHIHGDWHHKRGAWSGDG